jgi:hypothetical protein
MKGEGFLEYKFNSEIGGYEESGHIEQKDDKETE